MSDGDACWWSTTSRSSATSSSRYLERDGLRTLEAGDGETARATARDARRPSLVVLDLMLPGIDGLALCRWIRAPLRRCR